jgi:hypothetical protein
MRTPDASTTGQVTGALQAIARRNVERMRSHCRLKSASSAGRSHANAPITRGKLSSRAYLGLENLGALVGLSLGHRHADLSRRTLHGTGQNARSDRLMLVELWVLTD